MHRLYNKLKHQQQAAGLELAADQGAEQILMQAGSQQQSQHRMSTQRPDGQAQQRVRNGSNGSGGSDERRQQRVHSWPQATQPTYSQQTTTGMGYPAGASGSYRSAVGTSRESSVRTSMVTQLTSCRQHADSTWLFSEPSPTATSI